MSTRKAATDLSYLDEELEKLREDLDVHYAKEPLAAIVKARIHLRAANEAISAVVVANEAQPEL